MIRTVVIDFVSSVLGLPLRQVGLALRFAPAEAKAVADEERASGASPAARSPQVWVLDGTTPVAQDVVVVASDGERTARQTPHRT